ncbi:hypothetical protein [Falsihalocynthiibacter sp. CO-5D18]
MMRFLLKVFNAELLAALRVQAFGKWWAFRAYRRAEKVEDRISEGDE